MSLIQINNHLIDDTAAYSEWTQSQKIEFNKGHLENTVVTDNDEIILDQQNGEINDDYLDRSKINHFENVTFDTLNGIASLNRTFTFLDYYQYTLYTEWLYAVDETSDNGYILVGHKAGPGGADIQLTKINERGKKQWNKYIGGTNSDKGHDVKQTSDGGYIIVGATRNHGAGEYDVWLVKTDQTGNVKWHKAYGGARDDEGWEVHQTSDGGYIIAGFKNWDGKNEGHDWLLKTDKSGVLEWSKCIGGVPPPLVYNNYCHSVVECSDGGFVATGARNKDLYLTKFDKNGNVKWNKTYGGSESDEGQCVRETSDGGYIATGSTRSYGTTNGLNIWLLKTNSTGVKNWDVTFGSNANDIGYAVEETKEGDFVVTGTEFKSSSVDNEVFIYKTNKTGSLIWKKYYDGTINDEEGHDLHLTSDGGIIVVGCLEGLVIKTDMNGVVGGEANGYLYSTNILENHNSSSINKFYYDSSIPGSTGISIQFSQNNNSWFNSTGNIGGWDLLENGNNSLDLINLSWQGNSFYYKLKFTSLNNNVSSIRSIRLSYAQYLSSGTFRSQPFELEVPGSWKSLYWDSSEPQGTKIQLQLRTATSESELPVKAFIGPEGTMDTYYNITPSNIELPSDTSWIEFKVYFGSSDLSRTPILYAVTIGYNQYPTPPGLLSPANDLVTRENSMQFTWNFYDMDTGLQGGFQLQMDDSKTFNDIEYDSNEVSSPQSSYKHSYAIDDGIWYWRVRTQDSEGDWGPYSNYSKLIIDTAIEKPVDIQKDPNDWTNQDSFIIDWTNPKDLTGIKKGAYYYIGNNAPGSQGEGAWAEGKPITISGIEDGERNLYLWLEDNAGNRNYQNYISTELKVDTSPPDSLSISINQNSVYTNDHSVELDLEAADSLSGLDNMSFSFNNEVWTSWEPFTAKKSIDLPQGDGEKSISFRVDDKAGNIAAPVTDNIILDTTPPENLQIIINNGEAETGQLVADLSLSATDTNSGIDKMRFSSDGSTWQDWVNFEKDFKFVLSHGDGEKIVYFRASDKAGNVAKIVADTIILNTSKPDTKPDDDIVNKPDDKINDTIDDKDDDDKIIETPDEKKGLANSMYLIILAIIAIVIVIVVLLFVKRKKPETIENAPEAPVNAPSTPEQPIPTPTPPVVQPAPAPTVTQTAPQPTPQPLPQHMGTSGKVESNTSQEQIASYTTSIETD